MRKAYLFLVIFVASLVLNSCRKEQSYYSPKIEGVEVHVLTDQRIWLGMDMAPRSLALQFGFCMDTLPNPSLEKNQLQRNVGQETYPMVYSEFSSNQEHYIRPWASNHFG